MASTTVAPLAFAARVAGTRLDSRRRCVVRSRVPAKSRLVSESAMKVDDSLNEDAPEGTTKSPVVLAAAAVATAIVLAASPARGAEARPSVDVGAHDYYLETLEASGVRPASIEVQSAPATGLKRFGSAATAADETASLVSTAFAVGLAAALGLSGKNKKGPKPGSSKSNNAATAKKSNIVKKTSKPFNRKTTAGTAYVPSYRGYTASSSSSSRGGSGASRDSGSGPAPAMQAAAALGATVVLGGLAGAGPAVLEAEGAAVAAAATSAVLLGTAASAAASTQTKKKADVRSNIITFKTAVAPAPKTRTKIINRTSAQTRVKAPPAKPPFGGAGNAKAKPRRSPGDAGDSATSQSAAVLAVVGLGALLLAGSAANPDQATKTKTAKSDAKSFASKSKFSATFKAPTFEAPAVDLPAIPAMDWNKNVFAELEMPEMKVSLPEMKIALPEVSDSNAVAPLVGATLLLASVATLAGVGLERKSSRAYDPAAAAKSVAEAQVWIDTWQRSILYPENPEHVFSAAWDRNAPTLERVAEASTYAAEAEQARRPRPYSRADVERRAGDAQAWIDAWALGLLAESVAKKNKRSDEALHDWETGRIIGAWNKGLAESAEAPRAAAETRSAVAARVKQAQTWINAWQKSLKASATLAKSKKALEVKKAVKAKKGATKTKKGQGEKSTRRAYYETVAGVKYDKAVLEACRGFVAKSGALDLSSAKTTWALIADGTAKKQVRTDGRVVKSAVTNVELATALYVLETFEWADDAAAWFRERIEAVDKK
jgi:hypothetical protein